MPKPLVRPVPSTLVDEKSAAGSRLARRSTNGYPLIEDVISKKVLEVIVVPVDAVDNTTIWRTFAPL
jgi:hypothetical protein